MSHFSWTDQCFLVLLILSTALIIRSLRREHTRHAFTAVFGKPIAASSAVILMFFLIIGVLDSIPLRTDDTTKKTGIELSHSALDKLLAPLGEVYEQTYSKPLAITLFDTETIYKHGQVEKIYPRLVYPPATIQNKQDVMNLVILTATKAVFIGLCAVIAVLIGIVLFRYSRHKKIRFKMNKAGGGALLVFFICLSLALMSYWLSRQLHILGTGKIGQDIFYYAVKSIRTGLVIGLLTTLFMMPLALLLGIAAGYFGGVIDDIIQYIYTTLSSIPGVLLITASVLSMQTYIANHPEQFQTLAQSADARLLALCFILGVTSWTSLCRLLRAETLKLREIDFVLAAKALGSGSFKIITQHLLPNVMHIVLITLVLDFSFLVLAEAVLSYVGVGVSPMTISWGNMINAARLELAREPIVWWPMMAAFLFMFTLVLASNLFADAVRDAFDPHQT